MPKNGHASLSKAAVLDTAEEKEYSNNILCRRIPTHYFKKFVSVDMLDAATGTLIVMQNTQTIGEN